MILFGISRYLLSRILLEWLVLIDFSRLSTALTRVDRDLLVKYCQTFKIYSYHKKIPISKATIARLQKYNVHDIEGFLKITRIELLEAIEDHSTFFNQIRKLEIVVSRHRNFSSLLCLESVALSSQLYELVIESKSACCLNFQRFSTILPIQVLRLSSWCNTSDYLPLLRFCPELLELHCSDCSSLDVMTLVVWCRRLKRISACLTSPRAYLLVAFHASESMTDLHLGVHCALLSFRALMWNCCSLTGLKFGSSVLPFSARLFLPRNKLRRIQYVGEVTYDLIWSLKQLVGLIDVEVEAQCSRLTSNTISLMFGFDFPLSQLMCDSRRLSLNSFSSIMSNSVIHTLIIEPGISCLSNLDMRSLSDHCHSLTYLSMESQNLVNDYGVADVVFCCPLKRLHINHCSQLTYIIYFKILWRRSGIRHLNASGIVLTLALLKKMISMCFAFTMSRSDEGEAYIAQHERERQHSLPLRYSFVDYDAGLHWNIDRRLTEKDNATHSTINNTMKLFDLTR